eukprot:611126-Prymnesium_polylepis.1
MDGWMEKSAWMDDGWMMCCGAPVEEEAEELGGVLLPPRGEEAAVGPDGLHEGVRRRALPPAAPQHAQQRVKFRRQLESRRRASRLGATLVRLGRLAPDADHAQLRSGGQK